MYNAFFGFSESPFSLIPDPAFFYRSEQHEEALANLVYGVQARKGFIVLSGEVGTGKTTMLECLRDYLEANYVEFAFIFNSRINTEQFFEMIAYDLDLPCSRTSKTEVLFALNQLLVEQAQNSSTVVLIVDEAHNLEWEVLEEIRLLATWKIATASWCRSSWPASRNSIANWTRPTCGSSSSESCCAVTCNRSLCAMLSSTSFR